MKILLSVAAVLFLFGCSNENKQEAQKTHESTTKTVEESTKIIKEEAANIAKNVAQKSKKIVEDASDATKDMAKDVADATKDMAQNVSQTTKKMADDVTQKAKEVTKEAKESAQSIVPVSFDAKAYFAANCKVCHGADGEKSALNKSQIIKGWEQDKVKTALKGYKDGSYGASMKSIMKAKVKDLDDTKIEAIAKYISTL